MARSVVQRVDLNDAHGPCLKVDAALDAALTAHASVFLRDWNWEIAKGTFGKRQLFTDCTAGAAPITPPTTATPVSPVPPTTATPVSPVPPPLLTVGPLLIVTSSLPTGQTGSPYAESLKTLDGRSGAWAVNAGRLPSGLTLAPDGRISGVPTAGGLASFAVTFIDALGEIATANFDIFVDTATVVAPGPPQVVSSSSIGVPWGRLQTYTTRNQKSGFISYVYDRFVRPELPASRQAELDADPDVAARAAHTFLRRALGYRAVVTSEESDARLLAEELKTGRSAFGTPSFGGPRSVSARSPAKTDSASTVIAPPTLPVERATIDPALDDAAAAVQALASSDLRPFSAWPDATLPRGLPGVYAIWFGYELLYAGCSYRNRSETSNPQAQGVWGRLQTHARGSQPSQLSDGIFRHFILRELTDEQRASEDFVPRQVARDFLQAHLSYRAVVTASGDVAREAEDLIRRGQTALGRPRFNAK